MSGAEHRYAAAALEREAQAVATAAPGGRNHQANASAYAIGQLVGADLLDAAEAERRLLEAAQRAGLPKDEARSAIRSGLHDGQKHPRRLDDQRRANGHAAAPRQASQPPAELDEDERRRIERARRIVSEALPAAGTLAETYLVQHRGIPAEYIGGVLYQPEVTCKRGDGTRTTAPAAIFPARTPDGTVMAVQAVLLARDGQALRDGDAKLKRTFGLLRGTGAVFVAVDRSGGVVACDGPEDALSIAAATKRARAVATLGAGNAANVPPRQGRVCWVHDRGEAPGERQVADRRLAELVVQGVTVEVAEPPEGIKDANDLYRERGAEAVLAMLQDRRPFEPPAEDSAEPEPPAEGAGGAPSAPSDSGPPPEDPRPPEAAPQDDAVAGTDRADSSASASGGHASTSKRRVLDPKDPLTTARRFIAEFHAQDGKRTLHHHGGVFHKWDGAAYQAADEASVRASVYEYLAGAAAWNGDKQREEFFKPTTSKVNDVMDALRAAANLPRDVQAPAWLPGAPESAPPAAELLSLRNGLLHLPGLELHPASPLFWTHTGLPFAFDPDAPEPREWQRFLASVWPDDEQAIETLQEIFGYLLTSDTRQQKIFLMVGPKRSGKGTIARILQALLGRENVAAPTLASLGQNFGLAPLIGKTAAIVADARLGGRADQHAIAERLLNVSGEDAQTIDRKYMPAWTGTLGTRFLILSNELPRLADASGALASRFIVLTMTRSFYGQEDQSLTGRLLRELPGILNWAIDGWQRLQERGHFVQPESSREAIEELEQLGSPITAFVKDCCTVAPGVQVAIDDLFAAWRQWCEDQGRDHPGTKHSFGRDLKAAFPGIETTQPKDAHGQRYRAYRGITLNG